MYLIVDIGSKYHFLNKGTYTISDHFIANWHENFSKWKRINSNETIKAWKIKLLCFNRVQKCLIKLKLNVIVYYTQKLLLNQAKRQILACLDNPGEAPLIDAKVYEVIEYVCILSWI